MLVLALATPGCARDRTLPNQLAASQVTTLAINSYLWRAAIDTVSFAPLLQANPNSGVIITDWYRNPKVPNERVKLTVAVLDPDLRADAIRVSAAKQVYQNGAWYRRAGQRRDDAEARGHHPDPRPRSPPRDHPPSSGKRSSGRRSGSISR